MDPPDSSKEDVEGLPPGWKRRALVRTNGTKVGRIDVYYYSPCGKRFRSIKKIKEFLGDDDLSCLASTHKVNVALASRSSTLLRDQKLDRPSSNSGSKSNCPSSRSAELKCPNSRPARRELSAVEAVPTEHTAVDMQGGHGDTTLPGSCPIPGHQKVSLAHLFTRIPRIILSKVNIGSPQPPIRQWRDKWLHAENPTLAKYSGKHVKALVVSVPLSEKVKTPVREKTGPHKKVASKAAERKCVDGSRKRKMGRLSQSVSSKDEVKTSDDGTRRSTADTLGRFVDSLERGGASQSIETESRKKLSCSQARRENRNQTAGSQSDRQNPNLRTPLPSKLPDRNKEEAIKVSTSLPAAMETAAARVELHQQRKRFDSSNNEMKKPSRKRHHVCPKKIAIEYTESESEAPPTRRDPPSPATLKIEDTPGITQELKHSTDPQPAELLDRGEVPEMASRAVAKERVGVAKQRSRVRARKKPVPVEESTDDKGLPPPKPVKPAKRPRKQTKSSAIDCSNREESAASSGQQQPLPLTTAETSKRPKKRGRKQSVPERRQPMGEPKRPRGRPRKRRGSSQQQPGDGKGESQSQQQAEDSGYPCSLSNSDASSRVWQSISPENQLSSLALIEDNNSQGSHSRDPDSKAHDLIPILHDSTTHDSVLHDSIPHDSIPHDRMPPDTTAFVATPCCDIDVLELHPNFSSLAEEDRDHMSPLAQEHDPNLQDHSLHSHANRNNNANDGLAIPGSHADLLADLQFQLPSSVSVAEGCTESTVTMINTSDHLTIRIFPELDALLDQSLEPEGIFEPSRMIISKVESLSGGQELLDYDDVIDILDSEPVSLTFAGGPQQPQVSMETAQTGIESDQTRLSGPITFSDSVAPAETAQTGVEPSQTCLSSLIALNSESDMVIATDATQTGIDSGQTCLSDPVHIPMTVALPEEVMTEVNTGQASLLQPGELGVKIEPGMDISIESEIEVVDLEPLSSSVSIANAGTGLMSSEPGLTVSKTSTEASQTTGGTSTTAQLGTLEPDPSIKRRRIVQAKRRLPRKQIGEDEKEPVDPSLKREVVAASKTAKTKLLDLAAPEEEPVRKRPRPISRSKSGRILRPSWKISTPDKKTTPSKRTKCQSPAAETPTAKDSVPSDHLTVEVEDSCPTAAPDTKSTPQSPLSVSGTDTPTSVSSASSFSMSLDAILKEMGSESSTAVALPHASGSTVPAAAIPTPPKNGSKKIKRLKLTKKPSPLVLFSESAATKQQRRTPDECSLVFDLDTSLGERAQSYSAVEDTHNLEVSLAPLDIEEPLLSFKQPLPPPVSCQASAAESVNVEQLPASVEEPSSGKRPEGSRSSSEEDTADKEEREPCKNDGAVPSTDEEEEREDVLEIFAEDYDRFTSYSCPTNKKREAPPKMPTFNSPPSPNEHVSPEYDSQASMPYKKEQVAQWVLEQRMSQHPLPPPPLGDSPLGDPPPFLEPPKCPSQVFPDLPPQPSSAGTCSSNVRWFRGHGDRHADGLVDRGSSNWQQFDSVNGNVNGGFCVPDAFSRSPHLRLPLPLFHGHPRTPGFWDPDVCEGQRDPPFGRSCPPPMNPFFESGLEHSQDQHLAEPHLPPPPPLPTHPHSSQDPFFTSPLPIGPIPRSQDAGNGTRYCKYYLRGHCTYVPCRFVHAQRDAVPDYVLEEAVFNQPLEKVPKDVIGRYVADRTSQSVVLSKFSMFVDLVRALMDKTLSAVPPYQLLTSFKVNFSTRLLSRLLDLCGEPCRSAPPLPPVHHIPTLARELFAKIQTAQGYLTQGNYLALMKTLANFNQHIQLYDVYQRMRQSGVPPSLEVLNVVLHQAKYLDHRVFQTLLDLKQCNPTEMEEAKFLNRLVDSVSCQLLEKHSDAVGVWLESSPHLKDKIGFEVFKRLFRAFRVNNQWSQLLTLLEYCPKFLPDLRNEICIATAIIVNQPGLRERAINLVDKMPEELAVRLSTEVLDVVMMEFADKGRSQRVSRLYHALAKQRKQLSPQILTAVMDMYIRQHNPAAAMVVLQDSLRLSLPVLPPVAVLDSLCQALEQARATQELYGVTEGLLRNKIAPSSTLLQCLLNLHKKDKAYSKIAEVVKKSQANGVTLDRDFYQKALVELRHWGQDQEAISAVYKALRKVHSNGKKSEDSAVNGQVSDAGNTSQDCDDISAGSASCPPPPAPPPSVVGGAGTPTDHVGGAGAPSMSLAGLLQRSSAEDQASLLELIEVNGRQGQFGAVAAILVSMQCEGGVSYDDRTVEAVWKTVTNSKQKPANAFASLVTHLSQSRAAGTPPAGSTSPPGEPLMQNDRWLVGQVGIGLMRECERNRDWQNAFVVLHHLHRFGIHYVTLSHPTATLPVLRPPLTPCGVALMAVKICLVVEQSTGALEVLKGCNWICASSAEELVQRTELLLRLTEHCLNSQMYQSAWECLKAIDGSAIQKSFVYAVTNVHNKLLQSLLTQQQSDFALRIYQTMSSAKLQCLPSIFTALLDALYSNGLTEIAKQLCKSAIGKDFYGPLAKGNLFDMSLPMGLSRVETHLLLESHLQRIARELGRGELRTLTVHFTAGSRLTLEEVLSHDCCPSLRATFIKAGSSCASIPVASLQHWLDAHSSSGSGGGSSTGVGSVNKRPLQRRSIKLKRSGLAGTSSVGGKETASLGNCAESCSSKETSPVKLPKESAVLSDSESQSSLDLILAGKGQKTEKHQRKEFRQQVCLQFKTCLQPYYKAKKFKTDDDYPHLLKVLLTQYYKLRRNQGWKDWTINAARKQEIKDMVTRVMSRCSTYSHHLDSELGLSCSSSE